MAQIEIIFPDKMVSYDTFMNDLATRLANKIHTRAELPEFMNQKQAFAEFGQGNVRRWRRDHLIEPCIRPGKVEYKTSRLIELQSQIQDYFNS